MKPKVLFIYELENESLWKDGLWAALKLLESDFEITHHNRLVNGDAFEKPFKEYDFILGWGGFGSWADKVIPVSTHLRGNKLVPSGLLLGGYASPQAAGSSFYDVIFHETAWSQKWIQASFVNILGAKQPTLIHAFGVNTDIYKPIETQKIWDHLTVGAFASWKRQEKMVWKEGVRMAIGQIQKNNLTESIDIIGNLLIAGVGVSDMVSPETLAVMYNSSKRVYIPANVLGGGERAVLEARACGIPVDVEYDNPKLIELLKTPVWDHHYYAEQIKKGIKSCLK